MNPPLLQLIHNCKTLRSLKSTHARLLIHWSVVPSEFVVNKLLRLDSRFGATDYAHKVFDEITQPNAYLWTSLVHGYVENRQFDKEFSLFIQMRRKPISVWSFTVSSVLKALARLTRFKDGQAVYGYVDLDNLIENGSYKYIFSTEGHLLPATPQISLVREHCSYFGAYCNSDDSRQDSGGLDLSTDHRENDSRFYQGWDPSSSHSDNTFHEFMSVSGSMKGLCPGLTHGQKFGILYLDSTDKKTYVGDSTCQKEETGAPAPSEVIVSKPDAESTGQREVTVVQSHSVVVVSNPEVESLQPEDKIDHDKDQELIEEEQESDPSQEVNEGA